MTPVYLGILLQRGASGPQVVAVQRALGVEDTGIFGPTTEQAVCAFQRGHGLTVDGVVGRNTWGLLFAPQPVRDLGETALEIARGYLGVAEQPLGSNRGPKVDQFNLTAGAPMGSFWCCAFVYHCTLGAALKLRRECPIPRTASCSDLYRAARAAGRLVAKPEPGDIFLCVGGERGHYHTGFVAGPVVGEHFATVEGNSNNDGSANGYAVVYRTPGRRLGSCHYIRL